MFVEEGFRNHEIGSKLVKSFLKWAKKKGVENVRVGALAQNSKALQFYRKLGFKDYEVTLEINF